MTIPKLIQKYFSKKDHQEILNELEDFYDNVKTGIKIAKQSPSSKKKIKSTFLYDKKKLRPLIKSIDKVLNKLKDVRFIGVSSVDEECRSLEKLKTKATKVLKYPKQPTNFSSQQIEGWCFDLCFLYEKYTGKKVWISNSNYEGVDNWRDGALFVKDALNLVKKIPDFTIHSAIRSVSRRKRKVKK